MNKTEFIQAIAERTSLDANLIKKVIDACETVLRENVSQTYTQPYDSNKANSFNKNVKTVQFHSKVQI